MEPMHLPGVEANPQPSPWSRAIDAMRQTGAEYPQIWHLFAYKPEATEHLAKFTQVILREDGPLTPGFRELIAAYTSKSNRCQFCMKSHTAMAYVLLDEALVDSVMTDMEASPLSDAEKALLRFVEKITHDSPHITPDDFPPLRAHGWTDEQLYYVITISALFNFYNRWIHAAGVHALSEEAHREGGKRSVVTGYVRK